MKKSSEIYPKLIPNIYTDIVKDGIFLYYNRSGYGGIVTVDSELNEIICEFEAGYSINECATKYGISKEELTNIVNLLVEKEILVVNEYNKPKRNFSKKFDCWFHLTNECTLDCSYCYIHKCKGKMSLSTAKAAIHKILNTCRKNNCDQLVIRFAGGEPMMEFDMLKQIVKYVHSVRGKIDARFSILTNGTIVNEEFINFVKSENIRLGISLDGIGKYNDKNRYFISGKGSYDCVITNIQKLLDAGIKPGIMLTVNSDNIDGLYEFTEKMIEMGMLFRFSLERDIDTGKPSILKSEDKLINVVLSCIDLMMDAINKGNTKFSFQLGDVYFHKPAKRSCGAIQNSCAIGHDGKIGACGMGLSKPFMNIFDEGDLLQSLHENQKEFMNTTVYDIEECKNCQWRNSCANACPLQTKSTYGKYKHLSPYCNFYKQVIPKLVKMYALRIYMQNEAK